MYYTSVFALKNLKKTKVPINIKESFQSWIKPYLKILKNDLVTKKDASTIASAYAKGLKAELTANGGVLGGNAAKTTLTVLNTTDGKAQIVSLGSDNVCIAYRTGEDLVNNNPQEIIVLKDGEPYVFENLINGSRITSSEGAYGFSGQVLSSLMSPMPLGCEAFSFTETFFYAFRGATNNTNDIGLVFIANGAVESVVSFTDGAGNEVDGQSPVNLPSFGFHIFHTAGNKEYKITATNPVSAGMVVDMYDYTGQRGAFVDSKLIMPLTNDGLTWPRYGFLSALYPNTQTKYYVRDGAKGSLSTAAPNSPVNISTETGASDADYEPNGATRFKVGGLASAYSGADTSGSEATPMFPVSALAQKVALPLQIRNSGDGGNNGIAICSPYEGTAEIWEWNPTTEQSELKYTVPLRRNLGREITSSEDQLHPSAALLSARDGEHTVKLDSVFYGGYVKADVPIHVVFNSEQNQGRGQSDVKRKGTSGDVVAISANDDEQASTGITRPEEKAEIVRATDGFLYRRQINNTGELWVKL